MESISWFQNQMSKQVAVKPEHSTSALEKGYHTTFSKLRMDWQRCFYTQVSSHFSLCRIIQLCPRLNGQSCGFLPLPNFQHGHRKFNSRWAAYNSSSLGANTTGGSDFPLRNQTGHLEQNSKMDTSSSSSFQLYTICFLPDYYSHHTCSFTSLNLEVKWRRRTARKENPLQTRRNWQASNTPAERLVIPAGAQPRAPPRSTSTGSLGTLTAFFLSAG